MKPIRDIVASRPLAQHCHELMGRRPDATQLQASYAVLGEDVAKLLGGGLAPLLGGALARVRCGAPEPVTVAELTEMAGPLAANCVIATGDTGGRLIATVAGGRALALTDRAFGGKGDMPDPLPEEFPFSAQLTVKQLEGAICEALSQSLSAVSPVSARVLRREPRFARLQAFPADAECLKLTFTVEEGTREPWDIVLAARADTLGSIVGDSQTARARKAAGKVRRRSAMEAPFADVPLELRAVLAERKLGAAIIASLKPGDTIPLAIARQVPLRLGTQELARGTIGTMDDRIAIRIGGAARHNDNTAGELE